MSLCRKCEPGLIRDHLKGFFHLWTAATIFKPYTTFSGDMYEWHSYAVFLLMYFVHQPTTLQKRPHIIHAKVLTVWARQFIYKRKRGPRKRRRVNITTEKLRFYWFAPDIWLAGFENVGIYCFSEPSDWFSLTDALNALSVFLFSGHGEFETGLFIQVHSREPTNLEHELEIRLS